MHRLIDAVDQLLRRLARNATQALHRRVTVCRPEHPGVQGLAVIVVVQLHLVAQAQDHRHTEDFRGGAAKYLGNFSELADACSAMPG